MDWPTRLLILLPVFLPFTLIIKYFLCCFTQLTSYSIKFPLVLPLKFGNMYQIVLIGLIVLMISFIFCIVML